MSAPQIIDRRLLRQRRLKAAGGAWREADFLVEWALEDMKERLAPVSRHFETALILGAPGGLGRAALLQTGKVGTVIEADMALDGEAPLPGARLALDEEALPFAPQSLDLVVSLMTLQWINDLPGALVQFRRALRPDGLFIAILPGGETLSALRAAFLAAESEVSGGASPRVLPFADVRDMGGLLQRAGFALPVTDVDRVSVTYRDPLRLLRDLRFMGAQNCLIARAKSLLPPAVLARAMAHMGAAAAEEDGKVRVSFDMVAVSGWAPHESQQKPLKPGSAKVSLKDILEKK